MPRPRGENPPIPPQQLMPQRVEFNPKGDMQAKGFKGTDGKYHHLRRGEELVFIRETPGQERVPYIRQPSGKEISFEDWKNIEPTQDEIENEIKAELPTISPQLISQRVELNPKGEIRGKGFRGIDGKTYHLRRGEELILIREKPGAGRVPYIRKNNGKEIPFEQWKQDAPSEKEIEEENKIEKLAKQLDRDRLNKLVRECSKPGALFGVNVNLGQTDREQIELVAEISNVLMKPFKETRQWKQLQDLITQQSSKDDRLVFSLLMPPKWLKDGGEKAPVKLVGNEIQVPTTIHNLYRLNGRAESAVETSKWRSNQKGLDANSLGQELSELAHFLKKNKVI